jgi:hypothetical protein
MRFLNPWSAVREELLPKLHSGLRSILIEGLHRLNVSLDIILHHPQGSAISSIFHNDWIVGILVHCAIP